LISDKLAQGITHVTQFSIVASELLEDSLVLIYQVEQRFHLF
jgi:hypothetical protein